MSDDRKTAIRFIQDAIDRGATTVEEIHKSIADLPLKILEENDLLKESAKQAQRLQDHTLGAIYDVIWGINEQVDLRLGAVGGSGQAPGHAERKSQVAMLGDRGRGKPGCVSGGSR